MKIALHFDNNATNGYVFSKYNVIVKNNEVECYHKQVAEHTL